LKSGGNYTAYVYVNHLTAF